MPIRFRSISLFFFTVLFLCYTNSLHAQFSSYAQITAPLNGASFHTQQGAVEILGSVGVDDPDFLKYQLFYQKIGSSLPPMPMGPPVYQSRNNEKLGTWVVDGLKPARYLIKLKAEKHSGHQFQSEVFLNLVPFKGKLDLGQAEIGNLLTNITETDTISETAYDISNGKIVFTDQLTATTNSSSNIFVYDMTTKNITQITTDSYPIRNITPKIHNNRIVWGRRTEGQNNDQIFLYDLTTNTTTQLTSNIYHNVNPDISDNYMVWDQIDTATIRSDSLLQDLTSGQITNIATKASTSGYAARIHGNRVVYSAPGITGGDAMFLYDIATQTSTEISGGFDVLSAHQASLDDDYIVWNSAFTLFSYEIATGQLFYIPHLFTDLRDFATISSGQIVWNNRHIDAATKTSTYQLMVSDAHFNNITQIPFDESNPLVRPLIENGQIAWTYGSGNYPVYDIYTYTAFNFFGHETTHDAFNHKRPKVSGKNVVWTDFRNGGNNPDIYLHNFTTGEETQLINEPHAQMNPDIFGDTVVYEDNRNSNDDNNADIYVYSLITHQERPLFNSTSHQRRPVVFADTVVYEDDRNGNWDIYMYDLSNETETRITSNSADQLHPTIWGNQIVWYDFRDNSTYGDLWGYNLLTHTERKIANGPMIRHQAENQFSPPAISGNRIVFGRYSAAHHLFMLDLATGTEISLIANEPSISNANPSIAGDFIVWTDHGADPNDLSGWRTVVLDLRSGKSQYLSRGAAVPDNTKLSGTNLVWSSFNVNTHLTEIRYWGLDQ